MKETMQLFAAVGSFGAGKTTFVLNVIQTLESQGFPTKDKVAYVVNDEGALIDGELARQRAKVVTMTNGCFTCFDTADLRATLERLEKSGISWVFLEGFGLIPGNETRKFLESCPYPFHIICLISAKHYVRDMIRYSDVVKSQVKAATIAVGVTKHEGDSVLDLDAAGILEFVAKENPGIPIVPVPNSSSIPSSIIDIFEKKVKKSTLKMGLMAGLGYWHDRSHKHHKGCGCKHHQHSHDHHRVHNMHPYSYELTQEATLDDLRKVFGGKDFLLRVKGAVGGRLFNEVHGDWLQTLEDSRRFVTFYASREVEIASDLPGLLPYILTKEVSVESEPGHLQLRRETVPREDTVCEIKALLDESPREPLVLSSTRGLRIITHPENLQNAKEISRRPYVKDEWFPQVLKRFMEYWIRCGEIIQSREEEIVPEDIAKNRYELAVSMVWWSNRYGEFFGPEIIRSVERLHPGAMAAEGIRSIPTLIAITPPETVSWQCLEFTEALSYGMAHGDDPERIIEAARHCLSLATTPELRQAWSESVAKLEAESRKILT